MIRDFSDEVLQSYPFAEFTAPASWAQVALTDIAADVTPGFASGNHSSDGVGVPHLRPMNVDRNGAIDLSVVKSVLHNDGVELRTGDVLFNNTNSTELIGKTAVISLRENGFAFSNHMTRVRPEEGIHSTFLARQLHFLWMTGYMKHRCTNHVNQASISTKALASTIPILLPPSKEQTRIVEKLDEILSDLDSGVAELKAAQNKLAKYRHSMLKTAMDGTLTAKWRQQNKSTEDGAQLLDRILAERHASWEAKQLIKFEEDGKTLPPKDWQKKYPEPVQPGVDLPELPQGWAWASLSQIGWLDRGRSRHRPRNAPHLYGGAYPFVQTGDIRNSDTFISSAEATYSDAGLEQSRLWPAGTMCITIAANIGKTAILAMDACFPDSIVGFRAAADEVFVRYVEYFMRTVQQKLEDEAPATAQKNINLEVLGKVVIPLPPMREQVQIVKLLDERLVAASDKEREIHFALRQCAAQRKNVFKTAFSGQLVKQDSTEEPASVLLERIQQARNESEEKSVSGKSKRKSKEFMAKKSFEVASVISVLKDANRALDTKEIFERTGRPLNLESELVEGFFLEIRQALEDKFIQIEREGDIDYFSLVKP